MKITPQAGDLWKVYGIIGVINSEDSPHPEDWPISGNIRSNPSWHEELISNYWFVYEDPKRKHFTLITNDGSTLMCGDGSVEDGKNGWELVYRSGWHKIMATMHAHEYHISATWEWKKDESHNERNV